MQMPGEEKRQWREEEGKDADGRVMAPKPQQFDEAACAWRQGSWGGQSGFSQSWRSG